MRVRLVLGLKGVVLIIQWVPVNIIPTVHLKDNMIICGIFYNAGVYTVYATGVYTNVYCS